MKKVVTSALSLVLCLCFCVCLVSCDDVEKKGIWENADYLKDTTVGEGSKEVTVIISGEEQSITLTVKTDESTLGEALYKLKLINNASFFDTLIGMKADWNEDQAYWAFYDGEGNYMQVGVGEATISGGETYKFVYTVGF